MTLLILLGLLVVLIIAAWTLGAAFFLIVPTFSETSGWSKLGGLVLLGLAVWMLYAAFHASPIDISWGAK